MQRGILMRLSHNPVVQIICITNNPLVKEHYPASELYEVSVEELFLIARRRIASGHTLLSHPLSSSIRPDVGPYKSIVLERAKKLADLSGLQWIASAIAYIRQLNHMHGQTEWDEVSLRDFQEVDYFILSQLLAQ